MDTEMCFRILEKYDPECAEFYRERDYLIGADMKRYAEGLACKHSKKKDNLPDEFHFISHINDLTRGQLYFAKRNHEWSDEFIVTLGPGRWEYDGQELEARIKGLDFEIVSNSKPNSYLTRREQMKFHTPIPGDTREVKRFAWYPIYVNGTFYWLEWVTIHQSYNTRHSGWNND